MGAAIQTVINQWETISPVLTPPQNEADYNRLVSDLDAVLDAGGAVDSHPLAGLADCMGDLIAAYEKQHHPIESSGIDAIKYLMDMHGLKQSDLPDIGSQGVVSEILSGKRSLNINQVRQLSKRFNVSAAVFLN